MRELVEMLERGHPISFHQLPPFPPITTISTDYHHFHRLPPFPPITTISTDYHHFHRLPPFPPFPDLARGTGFLTRLAIALPDNADRCHRLPDVARRRHTTPYCGR